jgi:hypothetical protein
MRTVRACAALLLVALAACTGSSDAVGPGSKASSSATSSDADSVIPGCPTDAGSIESLFSQAITHVEGAANGSTEQVCAFGTSATDLGALSVTYLRFPRPELAVRTLADARRRYGTPLPGHRVVSMPSWGTDAFLDESILPNQDLVAEFAWVPGFEIILGMHSDDRHVAERRRLINRLVALTR